MAVRSTVCNVQPVLPVHIADTLHLIRQNAEEDLSNILHIQV